MSIIVLLCLLFGVAAILLLVLFFLQRRQLNALELVSLQVQRIALGDSLDSRIELHTDQRELAEMVTAVNHLLDRVVAESDRAAAAVTPIGSLGDRVHEAVLIHGKAIRYVNPQFANLMGSKVEELLGRRLEDLVPPDHAELVADNMRRRLAGEPAAERYEIDLVGFTGQSARLELSTWVVDFEGGRALLIVGVEVVPAEALRGLPHTPNTRPRPEPGPQAPTAGTPLTLGRRALMIRPPGGAEHLVELSAAPIQMETGETIGAVVLLHDVTEMRGMARQMSYQATHDALTGLVNRREFERRLQEAVDTAHRGDGAHVLCYLDLDRFK